jgi:hypothetical protein
VDETKYWLWLNMVFGTGNHRIWEVTSFYRNVYASLTSDSSAVSLNENENKNVFDVSLRNAEAFLENGALQEDELAQSLRLDPSELMTEHTVLEIFDVVRSLSGKMFELIK